MFNPAMLELSDNSQTFFLRLIEIRAMDQVVLDP